MKKSKKSKTTVKRMLELCVCVCVCVCVRACVCIVYIYICVLLCMDVQEMFSICMYEKITATNTHKYIKKKFKKCLGHYVANSATYRVLYIQKKTSILSRGVRTFIHTCTQHHLYVHKHTHTHTQTLTRTHKDL